MRDRRATYAVTAIAAIAVLVGAPGCDLSNPGVPVPPADVSFPIAIAVAREPRAVPTDPPAPGFLLVVNSNFDLRYSAGTLQSWSLDALHAAVDDAVATGTCGGVDQPPCPIPEIEQDGGGAFLTDEVLIGSHADGIAISSRADRVYIPVRSGRGVLTWVDLDPQSGLLGCDQVQAAPGEIPSCSAAHRGADVADGATDLQLPTDPVAVVVVPSEQLGAGVTADALVVPHRSGRASLFLADPGERPVLVDVISGISQDVVSAVRDPSSGFVWLTSAGVLAARVTRDLIAIAPVVSAADPDVGRLAIVRRVTLSGVSDGLDTRDIAFDPTADRAWVLSRRPEAVITLDFSLTPPGAGLAPLGELFAVAAGPSRILRVEIGGRPLLVVSCYDANNVSVVDPELGLVATVAGLAGPFEMAFDEARGRLFVTNFRNSTIAVIDLEPLATSESPRLLATLATVDPPSPF